MLPHIGVYEYDVDLHTVLLDCYCRVSNRMLLHHLVTEPLYAIRDQAKSHRANPYILRERHRKWLEYLNEHVGIWLPLPTWDELMSSDDRDGCFGCEECLCDHLYSDGCEWELFGDDVDLAYDLIDRLHTTLLVSDDVHTVVEKILEANPEMPELVVVAPDLNVIYVVRSKRVELCHSEVPALTGYHAFDNLADGARQGDVPTFTLDEDVVEAYLELCREDDRRSAC